MRFAPLFAAALFIALFLCPNVYAQGTGAPQQAPAPARSVKASAPAQTTRVVVGTLSALDTGKRTVRITPEKGEAVIVALYDRDTRFVQETGSVRPEDFKPNAPIVARLSFPAGNTGTPFLRSLSSREAYEAEQHNRRDVCIGTVVRHEATLLEVERGADKEHVTFRISAKTRFVRDADPVLPADYPIGAAVAVKPRALPGGGVMAQVVADSGNRALEAYKDGLTVWDGYVVRVDVAQKLLTIRRSDGVSRTVAVLPSTPLTGGRNAYTFATLPATTPVKVHLMKGELPGKGGQRTADNVAILTRLPKSATQGKISDNEKPGRTP